MVFQSAYDFWNSWYFTSTALNFDYWLFEEDKINIMTITRGSNVPKAIDLLKQADIIIIDVDSTISRNEGIDILARHVKKEKEITQLKSE